MAPETLLLGALLFVAVVAGWLLGRRQRSTPSHRSASAPVDYYRGLDHLLRDESDEAVSVLQGMAEADPGVVEIHFALATLFRRRGETDRAIRVHQDLLSRPRLSNRHRAQALLDLAEDYLKAGLFDRAEALFRQLAEQNIYRAKALRRLIDVYERQRDWQQAAETRVKLAAIEAGEHDPIIAQYYCEQAAEALQRQDLNSARKALQRARSADRDTARGALMRAELALRLDDTALAARLSEQLLIREPLLVTEVMPLLQRCLTDDKEIEQLLERSLRKQPELGPALGRARLATDNWHYPVAELAARDVIGEKPALLTWLDNGHTVAEVAELLSQLGLAELEYRCSQCGYDGAELHWQCPACGVWDSTRPRVRLQAR